MNLSKDTHSFARRCFCNLNIFIVYHHQIEMSKKSDLRILSGKSNLFVSLRQAICEFLIVLNEVMHLLRKDSKDLKTLEKADVTIVSYLVCRNDCND